METAAVCLLSAVLYTKGAQISSMAIQGKERHLRHGSHAQLKFVGHNICYTPTKVGTVLGSSSSMGVAAVCLLNTL